VESAFGMNPICAYGLTPRARYVSKIRSSTVQSYTARPWESSVYASVLPHLSAGVPSPVFSRLCVRKYTCFGRSAPSSPISFRPSFIVA
jgi:hypothetical protein